MNLKNISPNQLAALGLRLAIGINLFSHGVVRLGASNTSFNEWLLKSFANSLLPIPLINLSAQAIPITELLLGLLLIIGFQIPWVIFVACLEMCALIFGMCLIQNWEIVGFQMVYIVCYFLLLNSSQLQFFSIDSFRQTKKI